jgi:hypothetical protein
MLVVSGRFRADHQAGDGLGRRQRVAAEGLQVDAGTGQP